MADAGPEEPSDVTLTSVLDAYRADGYEVSTRWRTTCWSMPRGGRSIRLTWSSSPCAASRVRQIPPDNLVVAAITTRDG